MKLIPSIQFVGKIFLAIGLCVSMYFASTNIQRSFICGDQSLSLHKKPDTVTDFMLVIWGFSPLLIMFVCEMFINFEKVVDMNNAMNKSWKVSIFLFHRYFLGMMLLQIVTLAAKFFTRAHRPHFFETCMPDQMVNCTLGTLVNEYKCTNTEVSKMSLKEASMSFFSGHAAVCFYSCFFICWYLQKRMKRSSLFVIPFIQTALICLAYFGSISRVFDHRHHWWDVLAGAIVGILSTCHTCLVLCKNRHCKTEDQSSPTDINNTFLTTDEIKSTSD